VLLPVSNQVLAATISNPSASAAWPGPGGRRHPGSWPWPLSCRVSPESRKAPS